jgi:hypothetical protein
MTLPWGLDQEVKVSKSSQSLVAVVKPAASKSDAAVKAKTPKRFKQ